MMIATLKSIRVDFHCLHCGDQSVEIDPYDIDVVESPDHISGRRGEIFIDVRCPSCGDRGEIMVKEW